ncbi:hypothetical protein F5B18DRAFT_637437 [Nemania serpens]|nr:hypothetical protein F5B18DRAFT_637437 [Nemania serpens]
MAYRSGRSELSERDFAHRRAPVREYEDDLSVDVNIRERDRIERVPAFLREEGRRAEAGPMVLRAREVETVDRRRPRSPSPQVRFRERIVERERERVPSPLPERRPVRFVERSPSPPPPRVQVIERVERRQRERERSPSPDRERELIRLRIERERERERTPSPEPSPSPPPQPQVIRGPTIEREIITHYRDIDHGIVRAKPPTPPPPPPRRAPSRARSQTRRETDIDIDIGNHETDIDIHTRSRSRHRSQSRPRERPRPLTRPSYDDDDLIVVRNREKLVVADSQQRRRAHSAAPRPEWNDEAESITGRIDSRGRMGEAWNGATRDWTIVDVPPGTERVKMDGVGGGGAEVTWQRYNGVRRSKFIPDRDDSPDSPVLAQPEPAQESSRERLSVQIYDSKRHNREVEVDEVRDRRISIRDDGQRSHGKRDGMWTEITKDLVNREAIERLGYEYEEKEWVFYVTKYLSYEDVRELVDLTKDIRRARKRRAREYEEHDHYVLNRHHHSHRNGPWDAADDERIVEREVIYDSSPRYYR